MKKQPKLKALIESKKGEKRIDCLKVKKVDGGIEFDPVPGCKWFSDIADMKESLCWCYNADPDLFKVEWFNGKKSSTGVVYLFD